MFWEAAKVLLMDRLRWRPTDYDAGTLIGRKHLHVTAACRFLIQFSKRGFLDADRVREVKYKRFSERMHRQMHVHEQECELCKWTTLALHRVTSWYYIGACSLDATCIQANSPDAYVNTN